MTRSTTIAVTLTCLGFGAFLLPALSQGVDKGKPAKDAPVPTARKEQLEIMRLLKVTINTKPLQERLKLKTALENITDQFGGKLSIMVDKEGFNSVLGADTPDIYEEEVSLPPVPAKMSVERALRLLVSQVGKGQGIFVIRRGYIEIAPRSQAADVDFPFDWNIPGISFEKRPLAEVLQELSAETGLDIHLDPNVGDKAAMPISATFVNASLEDVLVTITEMARLKYVPLGRSAFVTTPEHAKVVGREEKLRRERRKMQSEASKAFEGAR
jgi:hypothetical protein